MATVGDRARFQNHELVLAVSKAVDRRVWDESKYEDFLEELCGDREYQKAAIKTALRYLLAGEHQSLRSLAKSNFETNPALEACYGSWPAMERRLQLPDQLAASLDLATGTGKSFVLYGLAAIMLAEGVVDRVLVLCPSTTIEAGLLAKFRSLAGDEHLQGLLPAHSAVSAPRILNATETIVEGSICVENYHAILDHVGSSVRDSLRGKGARTLVLNDEAHHVANDSAGSVKRWKEFLLDPSYGFSKIVGVSGTCYVGDQYFSDVIFRYSLKQAIDEGYVKKIEYVAEMPRPGDADDKWQLIVNRHEEIRRRLHTRGLRPLTIIVTSTIARCEQVAEDLRYFLAEQGARHPDDVRRSVLAIYNGAEDLPKLPAVDSAANQVEWIVAVSMLNEGWDVKRVFQIVPHEERAFNSKLLIAQVLGRGLRVPDGWSGEQPEVSVFNHDAWADNIRHLVNEILERERRLTSRVSQESEYHFDVHQIEYALEPTAVSKPMSGSYSLLAKGYVDLATDAPVQETTVEFERASSGERYQWTTTIRHRTFSPEQIAEVMYERLEEAWDPEDGGENVYTKEFDRSRLEDVVRRSLDRIGAHEATDSMRQKFLQALGPLRRKVSETVRYEQIVEAHRLVSTRARPSESVSAPDLRRNKAVIYTDATRAMLDDDQRELFDEVTEEGAGWKTLLVPNRYDFKTPVSLVIADSDNERRFVIQLVKPDNASAIDAWLKATSTRFYEIEYAWKKGAHAKRARFSPDYFIRCGDLVLVVEVKDDEEIREPSDENRKKNEYALAHFERLNDIMKGEGSSRRYKFVFLSPRDFSAFFQSIREGRVAAFRSQLDVALAEVQESA